jgi:hypothetical protein
MSLLLPVVADLPNPVEAVGNAIGDAAGGVASRAAEASFDFFMRRFADALANAASKATEEVLHYLDTSSGVSLDQGWFAGPRARAIVGSVVLFASVLMVLFLLAAVVQGVLNGDPMMMLRPAFVQVPISIFAIVALGAVTSALLAVTDSVSAMVLSGAPESVARFLNFGQPGSLLTTGLLGIAMVVVFIVAAILVWVELVVRSSLLYLLLAFAPLVLAARVWPVLQGAWHQLCRFGIALIVSKFAIALALGLGAAALGGGGPGTLGAAGPNANDVGTQTGLSVGGFVVGACLMLLAAFAPFVILKLLPVFEAAVLAQGIGRSPARAGQTAMQTSYYAQGLKRLAGGGSDGGGASGAAGPGGGAPSGGPGAATGGPASGGPAASPAAAGSSAGASGATAGATAGSAAGSGAAAGGAAGVGAAVAGPAAAVMIPLAVASRAKATAAKAGDTGGTSSESPRESAT